MSRVERNLTSSSCMRIGKRVSRAGKSIDCVLKSANGNYKSVYVASLDVAKAFDSVAHVSILSIAKAAGLPKAMVDYLDQVRSEQERLLWSNATPLFTNLADNNAINDEADILKKIVEICILLSGLGNSKSPEVVKETYPALLSVMKTGDVGQFVELSPDDRKEHLLELSQIVMGIRLFNKDCRKGGAGIDDLPDVLSKAARTTCSRLDEELLATRKKCSLYTATLIKVYGLSNRVNEVNLSAFLSEQFKEVDLETVKAALCFSRLCYECLSKIYNDVRGAELHIRTCIEQLRSNLCQLHETVRYRAAIPTIQVYPLFVQLSMIWRELQLETAPLSHINQWIDNLRHFAAEVEEPALVKHLQNRLPAEMHNLITIDSDRKIKLKGFCPWTLIQTSGALVPGIYLKDDYAFRSEGAANAWSTSTSSERAALRSILSCRPYLLLFLGLPLDCREESPVWDDEEEIVETEECGTQTELHPVESHIDKDYSWSVWEMKRRALRLARLANCKTTSQQTGLSAFKKSTAVQTVSRKDKSLLATPAERCKFE